MGLPGKPEGIDGSEVAQYHRDGRIQDIADYCETDVVKTYRVWLRYELFRGKLTEKEVDASEANLGEYIKAHSNTKPHLMAEYQAVLRFSLRHGFWKVSEGLAALISYVL